MIIIYIQPRLLAGTFPDEALSWYIATSEVFAFYP